jgi:2-succinyl-5-enolpyruvyl-6-hydroxy-3-cyclohexene-1-carboxylate synthase
MLCAFFVYERSTSTIGAAVANKNRQSLLLEILVFFMTAMPCGIIYPKTSIILINNGGGGIFRILPGHETAVFNTFLRLPLSDCRALG